MSNSGGQSPALIANGTVILSGVAGLIPSATMVNDSSSSKELNSARNTNDADSGAATLVAASFLNRGGQQFDFARTPAVFKFALASALGATAVWTPAAGKKFRLMAYKMMLSQNASLAAGAQWTPAFLDAAAATGLSDTFFVPTAAGATLGVVTSGWTVLGNGYLSSAANNVLNINLPVALASSSLVVQVIGTEE